MVRDDPSRIRDRIAQAAVAELNRAGGTPESARKVVAGVRATEVGATVGDLTTDSRLAFDDFEVVFQEAPKFIIDRFRNVVGIDALVQVFVGGVEQRVDPHRVFINPPTLAPDGGDAEVVTKYGKTIRVPTYKEDPRAAYLTALQESIREAPNPAGWHTKGTVTTVFAGTTDGFLSNQNTTYANVRNDTVADTANTTTTTDYQADGIPGPDFDTNQLFLEFDTSVIGSNQGVTSAVLSLWGLDDGTGENFTSQCRVFDWGGGTLTTADYRTGSQFAALPLAGTLALGAATGSYLAYTENGLIFAQSVNLTGFSRYIIESDGYANNTTPGTDRYYGTASANTAGTTNDPKLVITHSTIPAGAESFPATMRRTAAQLAQQPAPTPNLLPTLLAPAAPADLPPGVQVFPATMRRSSVQQIPLQPVEPWLLTTPDFNLTPGVQVFPAQVQRAPRAQQPPPPDPFMELIAPALPPGQQVYPANMRFLRPQQQQLPDVNMELIAPALVPGVQVYPATMRRVSVQQPQQTSALITLLDTSVVVLPPGAQVYPATMRRSSVQQPQQQSVPAWLLVTPQFNLTPGAQVFPATTYDRQRWARSVARLSQDGVWQNLQGTLFAPPPPMPPGRQLFPQPYRKPPRRQWEQAPNLLPTLLSTLATIAPTDATLYGTGAESAYLFGAGAAAATLYGVDGESLPLFDRRVS